jgi:hypothetical protein
MKAILKSLIGLIFIAISYCSNAQVYVIDNGHTAITSK